MLRIFNKINQLIVEFNYKRKNNLGISYSQEWEDVNLAKYLKSTKKGFYIDVGAHHPFRFSNTYLFYKKGWNGINIDATPESMRLFNKYRPRDINIETPISDNNKKINYYIFDEPALNSFSLKLSKERVTNTKYKIRDVVKLEPKRLSEVLDKYVPPNTRIDFMSIDVEGYEYKVLVSNNWRKYKPTYLLVEILKSESEDIANNKVCSYLKNLNYYIINKTGRTVMFKKKNENTNN